MHNPNFILPKLPMTDLPYVNLLQKIVLANRKIVEYNTFIQTIPNPNILLSTLTMHEALLSSRIEGTQATLEEVVEHQDNLQEKNQNFADIQEVINYRKALMFAVEKIQTSPLSLPFIKEIHKILLNGVRGANKDRGSFRKIQNWIGKPGSPIEEAEYIPPLPIDMNQALNNLEQYIHYQDIDPIIQTAIIHAQFELIHPFLDGNGRVGRLLIPLFLYMNGILTYPSFYMSEYFNSHRLEYVDVLKAISQKDDWMGWIEYFLTAVTTQAEKNIHRLRAIIQLFDDARSFIQEVTRSHQFMNVVEFMFSKPIFTASEMVEGTGIKKGSIYEYLKKLEDRKMLRSTSKTRNKVYYFDDLLKIIG